MQKIIPSIWLDSGAEEAAQFYTSLFARGKILATTYHGASGAKMSGKPEGSVMTVDIEIEKYALTLLNGGPYFTLTPAISLSVQCEKEEEIDTLFAKLSDGGAVLMPLQEYDFSPKFAWVADKYGVSWQLNLPPDYSMVKQKIAPAIMFFKDNYGKAHEAMDFYTSLFPHSKITSLYEGSDAEKPTVMHATFDLAGEEFIANDSGIEHQFDLTPAISFLVNCDTQEEMDTLYDALSAVPDAEQCGWVADKYGVSWQIVPRSLGEMMLDADPVRRERVMEVMLPMKRLNVAALTKAYEGE